MKGMNREEVRTRLNEKIAQRHPIVIAGAGCGLAAKAADLGGADFVGLYHSSFYRWECYKLNNYRVNCNQLTLDMMHVAGRVVKNALLLPGVICHDPTVDPEDYCDELIRLGASGLMSFPTVTGYEGRLRDMYEDAGFGLDYEMKFLRIGQRKGLFTFAYCWNEKQVCQMAGAGADVLLCHMGATVGGLQQCSKGDGRTLDDCVRMINSMTEIAKKIDPQIMIFAHGGPISSPEDTQYIYERTGAVGFLGASSIERIPVETPIVQAAKAFKAVPCRNSGV